MEAVIYLRVSTKEQVAKDGTEEGYSIPAQREACLRHIVERGWNLAGEYVDAGESARTADRPMLKALLRQVAEGGIGALVVHKIDRLARSMEDHVAIRAALRRAGVQLVSVTENIEETASGRLVEGIHALMAEFYSANLGSEIRKGMIQKAKMGGWPGRAPIGYVNVRERVGGGEVSRVEFDPERAMLVREAFRLYATGECSILELQATMHAKGLTSPHARRAGAPISASKLAEMLSNPFYVGVVEWGGVRYDGQHRPLVSRSVFDRVQDVLRAHNRVGVRHRRHDHYLKGLLFCGECGRRLSLTLAKGRYVYFYCLGQRGQVRTGCRQPYVVAGDAEALVEDVYRQVELPTSWVEQLTAEMEAEIAERRAESMERRAALTKMLAKIADERQKLLRAFYGNAIPIELLKSEQDRLTSEERAAKQELDVAETDISGWEDVLRTAIELAGNCHAAYLKARPSVRRRFNQAVLEAVYVKNRKVARAEFSEVFAPLFSRPGSNKPLQVVPTGFEPVSPP